MAASSMGRRAWIAAAAAACSPSRDESAEPSRSSATLPEGAPPPPVAASAGRRGEAPARPDGVPALPRLSLGVWPTPVEEAPRLARALGLAELWIKRDDRSSALFGGGKVRKLERLLADARARGCHELITFGAVGSNHAVATAAFGRQQGFRVTVRLAAQPRSALVARNLAACAHFGATIEAVAGLADAFAQAEREAAGSQRYVIAPGGTCELGNVAMLDAALELAAQIARGELPEPEVIVLAMGTMGSAVGVAAGLGAAGLRSKILAVRCSSLASSSAAGYARALAAFERQLAARGVEVGRPAEVELDARALGGGYGVSTPEAERAIELAREHAGLTLEATYTGKALSALSGRGAALGRRVLFWASQPEPLAIDPARVDRLAIPRALWRYLDA